MALFEVTPGQKLASKIDAQLKLGGSTLRRVYTTIRGLLYANPDYATVDEYGVETFDSNAAYTDWAMNTSTGLTPDELGKFARTCKTLINSAQSGTINDDVPEVIIDYSI